MAKIKIEDIKAEIEKDGWSLISDKYINLDEEMEFLCSEGHTVFSSWKKLRQHRDCPICRQNIYKNQNTKVISKKKETFRILALDQATYTTGYSIFDNKDLIKYGTFTTQANDEIARDNKIKQWLISMIDNWNPDLVIIEGIQLQDNASQRKMGVTVFETLARLQGILMETLYELNIDYKIAPTNTWRNHCHVKGVHRADRKRSMQLLVKEWFDVSVTDDCADAIGIGKYGAETFKPTSKIEVTIW